MQWNTDAPHLQIPFQNMILNTGDPSLFSSPDESESDDLSYSSIKVLALTWQGCIGRTYLAYDVLHYFYFVTPPSA